MDPADDRQTAEAYLARAAELEAHADFVDQHGGGRMSPRWRDAKWIREQARNLRRRARKKSAAFSLQIAHKARSDRSKRA